MLTTSRRIPVGIVFRAFTLLTFGKVEEAIGGGRVRFGASLKTLLTIMIRQIEGNSNRNEGATGGDRGPYYWEE